MSNKTKLKKNYSMSEGNTCTAEPNVKVIICIISLRTSLISFLKVIVEMMTQ